MTARPDGRPHSRPVWGVWLDETFYFSTASQIVGNLSRNPEITVHLESGFEVVILEGTAEEVKDAALVKKVVEAYNAKYQWQMDPESDEGAWYAVRPRVAFGWLCEATGDDEGIFGMSATRWRFELSP